MHLASRSHSIEGISFGINLASDVEEEVAQRYYHPERHWLKRREDITYVEMTGSPGSPAADDLIRIEYWNSHGVGQETILVFDDVDMINELFWDVTGSKERQVCMWDEFCDAHGLHFEHPSHKHNGRCKARKSTRAENLGVLALLAALAEAPPDPS